MAHYCLKPFIKNCSWRYTGVVIGTNRKLCNCFSDDKPCESEHENIGVDKEHPFSMELEEVSVTEFPNYGDVVAEKDIKLFFNETREEILKPFYDGGGETGLKQKLFKDASGLGRAELHNLYRESDYYKIPLSYIRDNFFTKLKQAPLSGNFITGLCEIKFPNPDNVRVLDYGCGPSQYGLNLALKGYKVTLADLNTPVFQFLQYLCKRYRIAVDFFACTEDYEDLIGEYDYIICSDVLEHVDEPEGLLKTLIKHLHIDGWMFLSTFFDDSDGFDPSHLKKNTERYNLYQIWLGKVVQMGLMPLVKDGNGVEKGFKKIEGILK